MEEIIKKEIKNSPGYFITDNGEVYNSKNKLMKTWFSTDGYVRIRLYSIKHKKRVNRTIHLLVAEAFLNGGKYCNDESQVNHIDGNKNNNNISNLELITGTENVNHAHNNDLYTFNLKIKMKDLLLNKEFTFRSLRELSRHIKLSMNYIRPRIIISKTYPINNRYVLEIDEENYLNHISKIKNNKLIYVKDHVKNKYITLTSYVQISILFGISYIDVARKMIKNPNEEYYSGGCTFSLNKIEYKKLKPIDIFTATIDRKKLWKKLISYKCEIDVQPSGTLVV